ncbi:unnamed protein product, partial [Nesidiocoris tenuis]
PIRTLPHVSRTLPTVSLQSFAISRALPLGVAITRLAAPNTRKGRRASNRVWKTAQRSEPTPPTRSSSDRVRWRRCFAPGPLPENCGKALRKPLSATPDSISCPPAPPDLLHGRFPRLLKLLQQGQAQPKNPKMPGLTNGRGTLSESFEQMSLGQLDSSVVFLEQKKAILLDFKQNASKKLQICVPDADSCSGSSETWTFSSYQIRKRAMDRGSYAAWPEESRVDEIRPAGGSNNKNSCQRLHAVQSRQQLVDHPKTRIFINTLTSVGQIITSTRSDFASFKPPTVDQLCFFSLFGATPSRYDGVTVSMATFMSILVIWIASSRLAEAKKTILCLVLGSFQIGDQSDNNGSLL